jgi:hypothetical protein
VGDDLLDEGGAVEDDGDPMTWFREPTLLLW